MSKEAMKLALEALEMVDRDDNDRDFLFPSQCYQLDEAITALQEALTSHVKETQKFEHEPAQQELVVFCMHWEDRWGCNHYADPKEPHPINAKPLYTSPPTLSLAQQDIQRLSALVRAQQITIDKLEAQRKPLTEQMMTKTALWDLVVSKGLVTIHSEQLAPGTWSAHLSVASWIEGHAKSCDISNEAAHGIKENT